MLIQSYIEGANPNSGELSYTLPTVHEVEAKNVWHSLFLYRSSDKIVQLYLGRQANTRTGTVPKSGKTNAYKTEKFRV